MMQFEDVKIGAFTKSLARAQNLRTGELRFASIIAVLLDELQQPPQWAEAVMAALETAGTETRLNGAEERSSGKHSGVDSGGQTP